MPNFVDVVPGSRASTRPGAEPAPAQVLAVVACMSLTSGAIEFNAAAGRCTASPVTPKAKNFQVIEMETSRVRKTCAKVCGGAARARDRGLHAQSVLYYI